MEVYEGDTWVQDAKEVFTLAQPKVWAWIIHKIPKANFTYPDWCMSLVTCFMIVQ